LQDFGVLNLLFGAPDWPFHFFFLVHQVFVVRQPAGVIQKLSHGDLFPIRGEFGKNLAKRRLVTDLFIVDEQHHRHRGKLFCDRRQTKVRFCVHPCAGSQFLHAITAFENHLSVFFHKSGKPWSFVCRYAVKHGGNLLLGRMSWILPKSTTQTQENSHQPYP